MPDSIDLVIPAYNAAPVIEETIAGIARQEVPDGWELNVYVSDDGSRDATGDIVKALGDQYGWVHLVESATNGGRSSACNAGVAAGSGSLIVICDADCRYSRPDALRAFADEHAAGRDAVIGVIELAGSGFWARYTERVTADRIDDQAQKGLISFSTPNIAIRRSLYKALDGYSTDYLKYGFEDKDFLIRLERSGADVIVREDISVSHDDDFDLRQFVRKARESGRYSAHIFRSRFPEHYQQLPYARCDAELSALAWALNPVSGAVAAMTELLAAALQKLSLPGFAVQLFSVRLAVCAAYFHGTRLAREDRMSAASDLADSATGSDARDR